MAAFRAAQPLAHQIAGGVEAPADGERRVEAAIKRGIVAVRKAAEAC
jgi:hypothetical protein